MGSHGVVEAPGPDTTVAGELAPLAAMGGPAMGIVGSGPVVAIAGAPGVTGVEFVGATASIGTSEGGAALGVVEGEAVAFEAIGAVVTAGSVNGVVFDSPVARVLGTSLGCWWLAVCACAGQVNAATRSVDASFHNLARGFECKYFTVGLGVVLLLMVKTFSKRTSADGRRSCRWMLRRMEGRHSLAARHE
ncbi:MAG TPA: hypothetical protein VIV60_34710 [Polyangiaceae bacterium]